MPENKDFKRLVRSRMQKTGESYTAARSHVLKKKRPGRSAVAPAEYPELAGMSDEAVRAKTGSTWQQWVETLDARGAAEMPHREIARHLGEAHGLPGWWAQTVTVGYERIKGLRRIGQRRGGTWEVNKSKTYPVPLARLWQAFEADEHRRRWLPGVEIEVRTATAGKSMRITWEDGTPVAVHFTAKGEAKSQVAVQHQRLASEAAAATLRRFWTERLTALGELLSAG